MAKFAARQLGKKTQAYAQAMDNVATPSGTSHDGSFTNPFVKTGDGKYYANPWIHSNNLRPTHAEVPTIDGGTESVPYWQAAGKFNASLSGPMYNMISEQLAGLQEEFTANLERTSNLGWENIAEVTETKAHTFDERRGGRGSRSYRG